MSGALISKFWKPVLFGAFIAAVLGFLIFATMRMRATYKNQADVALIQSQMEQLIEQQKTIHKVLDERLNALETSVYGTLEPAVHNPTPQEAWIINRDRELRERLRRLELWRIQQETKEREQGGQ